MINFYFLASHATPDKQQRKKKCFLRLRPWEDSCLFQHLAITSTPSTGRTHQLNGSFAVLRGASEHSTQRIVLWLIPTAPEEGNQAMEKRKNIIFLTFLHFLTCDLRYIAISIYIYD